MFLGDKNQCCGRSLDSPSLRLSIEHQGGEKCFYRELKKNCVDFSENKIDCTFTHVYVCYTLTLILVITLVRGVHMLNGWGPLIEQYPVNLYPVDIYILRLTDRLYRLLEGLICLVWQTISGCLMAYKN